MTFVLYVSLVVALIFNLLYVFIDVLPNLGFFVSNSINTIGKWSDLGIISALVVILSYLIIETQQNNSLFKKIAWVGLVVSGISAFIISEIIIWLLLGFLSVVYLVYKIVSIRRAKTDSINKNLPYTTIAVVLISFVMILAGGLLSQFTDAKLGIVFSETKPGIQSTLELSKNTIAEKPLLGVGENRFERAWQLYKPENINQTNFWGADFVYGYSYITSIPAKVGILGTLAWLLFIVVLVWNIIRALFKESDDPVSMKLNVLHSFAALFVLMVLALQVPSVFVLIISFTVLGLFMGTLDRNGLYKTTEISIDKKPKLGFLYIFSIIVLMILSIYVGYMSARQFTSTILLEKANYSLSTGDFDGTRSNIINSINVFTTDNNLRSLSNYYQIEINRLLQTGTFENQSVVDGFRELLSNSIAANSAAINFDPNNYINYSSLANIYNSLIQLNVEGSYDQAIEAYESAKRVNPNNPGILVDMGRSAFFAERYDEARGFVDQALEEKPRFVNAVFLLSQIQVQEGEIDNAIRSVQASIDIQPNDSNLYLQLGLLRYNEQDYQGAIGAFERAVILNRFFSNAKYFLGLSYEQVGRTEDALGQFEDLKLLNPENTEIDQIISDLRSGAGIVEEQIEDLEELPLEEGEDGSDEVSLEETEGSEDSE
jgi:tetratricopeptide (TPR) repeat protein